MKIRAVEIMGTNTGGAPMLPHHQRYLDEIVWQWHHRETVRAVLRQWTTRTGVEREKSTMIWRPVSAVDQMRILLLWVAGKHLRRSREYGLSWP